MTCNPSWKKDWAIELTPDGIPLYYAHICCHRTQRKSHSNTGRTSDILHSKLSAGRTWRSWSCGVGILLPCVKSSCDPSIKGSLRMNIVIPGWTDEWMVKYSPQINGVWFQGMPLSWFFWCLVPRVSINQSSISERITVSLWVVVWAFTCKEQGEPIRWWSCSQS